MFDLSKSATLNIGILNRLFSKRLDNELKNITVCQYLTLYLVDKYTPASVTQINSIYFSDRATISRRLCYLEKLGYIKRIEKKNNSMNIFEMTEDGAKVLKENEEIVHRFELSFSDNDKEILNLLVNKQNGSNLNE